MCHADGNEFKKSLIIMYPNLLLLINGKLGIGIGTGIGICI